MASWKEVLRKLTSKEESKKKKRTSSKGIIPMTERVSAAQIKKQDEERDKNNGLGVRYDMPVYRKGVLNRNTKNSKYKFK